MHVGMLAAAVLAGCAVGLGKIAMLGVGGRGDFVAV